jgi:hypothetical protein
MNSGAGGDDLLLIALHQKNGGDLSFILDTGAPFTLLDSSLAQGLGKELGSEKIFSIYGEMPGRYYEAPEIYLRDVRLQTGTRVLTMNLSRLSADLTRRTGSRHQIMGILGMDSLWHYCIQLDFPGRTIRFLDSGEMHPEVLGQAFTLNQDSQGCPVVARAIESRLAVDTGCNDKSATNVLGLDFLSRHLVTFDFPKRTMYLKSVNMGSPAYKELPMRNQGKDAFHRVPRIIPAKTK